MLKNLINNKNIPNDGKEFIGVNLDGWRMRAENKQELNKPIGDGIILVKQPQTVVSDIIIDDEEVAIIRMYSLRNNIQGEFAQSGMDYKGCDGHCNPFKYTAWSTYPMDNAHFAVSGGEIKWAKWIPKINVAGQYEIFVWYPNEFDNRFINFKISDLSSNVKYKIKDSKGETIKEINQQIDGGQWNSLGVYNFNVGTSGYIELSNNANGYVLADAVKFVYQGGQGFVLTLTADFNCDNKIDIQDFAILLSNWLKDKDDIKVKSTKRGQCTNPRNIDIVIDKNNRVDSLDLSRLLSCWGIPSQTESPGCWVEQEAIVN